MNEIALESGDRGQGKIQVCVLGKSRIWRRPQTTDHRPRHTRAGKARKGEQGRGALRRTALHRAGAGVGRQHNHSQAAAGLLGCWILGTRRARSLSPQPHLALSTIQAAKNCTQNPRGGLANVNCDAPNVA